MIGIIKGMGLGAYLLVLISNNQSSSSKCAGLDYPTLPLHTILLSVYFGLTLSWQCFEYSVKKMVDSTPTPPKNVMLWIRYEGGKFQIR